MTLSEREPGRNTRSTLPENQLSVVNSSILQPEAHLYGGKLSGLELVWSASKEDTQTVTDTSSSRRKFKPGIPRVVKNMYHRGNFEGFTTAVGIDALSTVYLWAIIPALTAVINTAASLTDFQLAAAAALTAAGRIGLKSLRKDAEALDKKHFGTNTFSTTAYGVTGNPLLSAGFGHFAGYSAVTFGNPIGFFSILTGNTSLLTLDFMATSIAVPSWYLFFNSIIVRGGFDKILNPIKEKRHTLSDKIKQTIKR